MKPKKSRAFTAKLYRLGMPTPGKLASFLYDVFTKSDGFISADDVYHRRFCEPGTFVAWTHTLRSKGVLNYIGKRPKNSKYMPGSSIVKYVYQESFRNCDPLSLDYLLSKMKLSEGKETNRYKKSDSLSITKKIRFEVLIRDCFRCTYCGASPRTDHNVKLEIDHITPVSSGGTCAISNLTTSCLDCNRGKGAVLI